MKAFCEKYGISQNILMGIFCLIPVGALVALLWWDKHSSDEKKALLNILFGCLIMAVVNVIPLVGFILSIIWLVFYIIFFVKTLQGKDTSIPVANNIANAIVK